MTAAILFAVCFLVIVFVFDYARRFSSKIPHYRSEGYLSFLVDAKDYAISPIALIRTATTACGNVFSIQVFTLFNVFLRGNTLNKFYLEVKEESWSFAGGMGYFLNKIVDPGYWDHYKTLLASVSRYVNTAAAQEYTCTVSMEETRKAAAEWEVLPAFRLFEAVSGLVHRITVRSLMGQDFYDHHEKELLELLNAMEADIGNICSLLLPEWVPHPPAKRMQKAQERVKEIFNERLGQRDSVKNSKSGPSQDYIAFTMRDKLTIPLKHLMASQHTMLMFAAHTSTVGNVGWNIATLLRHPETLTALTTELRAKPEATDSRLLQACISETLRYYAGIKTLRLAQKQVQIPGTEYTVPRGAIVSISPYLTHHDAGNFIEPDSWIPERWMNQEGALNGKDESKFELKYFPFGGGAHRCIGEKLARIMVTKTLVTLLREYDIAWATSETPDVTDFTDLDFDKVGSPWLKGDVRIRIKRAEPVIGSS
ncbi:Cytochrome P450 monooxygenase pynD [Paramyrothecium foliicola]|nr:Cytochrome P450 monooxygenase pynD [Paramyrothecium foliicola]